MELEAEDRRPVGRRKKTWTKVVEEDMRKLNITEDMVEDRKTSGGNSLMFNPRSGNLKLGTINENDEEDD